jgi:hypothetical protein
MYLTCSSNFESSRNIYLRLASPETSEKGKENIAYLILWLKKNKDSLLLLQGGNNSNSNLIKEIHGLQFKVNVNYNSETADTESVLAKGTSFFRALFHRDNNAFCELDTKEGFSSYLKWLETTVKQAVAGSDCTSGTLLYLILLIDYLFMYC